MLAGKKGKYIHNFQIFKWDQEKWKMRKFHFESHDTTELYKHSEIHYSNLKTFLNTLT